MCGIVGIVDLNRERRIDKDILSSMVSIIKHRGPDDTSTYIRPNVGFGFSRLGIIDLTNGMQPLFNEDKSIFLICNGEIYNYLELRSNLIRNGHRFTTDSDCEVILHLYEEYGVSCTDYLNGQFAFALYDEKKNFFFAARDHFGIAPFFYTITNNLFIFASEIKAILAHPMINREVDIRGLDQILTFPGLISPRTMFKNIHSLPNGYYIIINNFNNPIIREYWDLTYPKIDSINYTNNENYYTEQLADLFRKAVERRLRADVPLGFVVSGGLDSSMIISQAINIQKNITPHSFSICFHEKELSEAKYQRLVAQYLNSVHHEYFFQTNDIEKRLKSVVYHCECALKETFNTAALTLSELIKSAGIKTVLAGQGADELFAGYIGYRFDKFGHRPNNVSLELVQENNIRKKLWGDESLIYEKNYFSFQLEKNKLYSEKITSCFENYDCFNEDIINKERIFNIDAIHKRSYLDYKLRLCDHLLSDHGDRMTYANSVESRYPFLDKDLVNFVTTIPPYLKLNQLNEKYILKQIAKPLLPAQIINREKFGFTAPGSPFLLKSNIEYINDLLSYSRIKKEGYFNPDTVESLKKEYIKPGFRINVPFDNDILITVITFGIFLEVFNMPSLA